MNHPRYLKDPLKPKTESTRRYSRQVCNYSKVPPEHVIEASGCNVVLRPIAAHATKGSETPSRPPDQFPLGDPHKTFQQSRACTGSGTAPLPTPADSPYRY
jgi:hypothetical protein